MQLILRILALTALGLFRTTGATSTTSSPSAIPTTTPKTTTPTSPDCTYRPTATAWSTTGCEFNCPTQAYLAIDYLATIPCGCDNTRVAVRPTTTTLCYTKPNCQGQWDEGWMIWGTPTGCPAPATAADSTSPALTTMTTTVRPVGRMARKRM
ncbi:hypothetical protein B0T16DRAFT_77200 [Cercophora newfieldiana]|uniref:Uncharacterized protein n=1 Tax=Cercophora newfieldiana TaxID=92897 RepID=A0AA39YET4_9PEZI|nr:hypothetical protein B0T16DRAFT_77200 [Cercophora newfieldiana]